MKLHFIDFSTWEEHDAESKSDCINETEKRLWDMHSENESEDWQLGKTLAIRIN